MVLGGMGLQSLRPWSDRLRNLRELKRSPNYCEEILLALFSLYCAFQASLAVLRGWICMKPIFLQGSSRKMFRDESPFHFWMGFLFYAACSGGLLVRLYGQLS